MLFELKRIVCTLGLSSESRVTMEYAADLARRLGAELFLVHVDVSSGSASGPRPGEALEQLRADAEAYVGRKVQCRLLSGEPAAELQRHLIATDPDLVVVGMARRRRVAQLALGSVAESVTRSSPCPVLVVRNHRLHEKAVEAEEIAQYR